jgi:hypothetical protein
MKSLTPRGPRCELSYDDGPSRRDGEGPVVARHARGVGCRSRRTARHLQPAALRELRPSGQGQRHAVGRRVIRRPEANRLGDELPSMTPEVMVESSARDSIRSMPRRRRRRWAPVVIPRPTPRDQVANIDCKNRRLIKVLS